MVLGFRPVSIRVTEQPRRSLLIKDQSGHDGTMNGFVGPSPARARRRWVALLVGLAMALGLLGTACGATTNAALEEVADPESLSPLLIAAAPTTSSSSTVIETPSLPALPVPGPLPFEAYTNDPVPFLGRVQIPALNIDEPLHQGMTLSAINQGPSHWPGTAEPGQMGNMVLAGHRVTYSRPFHDLDLIEPGDEMIVETTQDQTFTYVAVGSEIVGDDALWIAEQTYGFTATTFACHPKGSARERIVVSWQLVDEAGVAVPALVIR